MAMNGAIAEAGGGRMHDAELPEEIAEIMFAELIDSHAGSGSKAGV